MDWSAVGYVLLGLAGGQAAQLVREIVLERRRDSSASARDERLWAREDAAYDRQVRHARLLVCDEFNTIERHLVMLTKHRVWPDPPIAGAFDFLDATEWTANKAILAEVLSDVDWLVMAGLHYSLAQLRGKISLKAKGSPLTTEELDRAGWMRARADALQHVAMGTHRLEARGDDLDLVDASDGTVVTTLRPLTLVVVAEQPAGYATGRHSTPPGTT